MISMVMSMEIFCFSGGEYFKRDISEDCPVIRMGGDEFLILANETSEEKAAILIQKVQEKLREKSKEKIPLQVLPWEVILLMTVHFQLMKLSVRQTVKCMKIRKLQENKSWHEMEKVLFAADELTGLIWAA